MVFSELDKSVIRKIYDRTKDEEFVLSVFRLFDNDDEKEKMIKYLDNNSDKEQKEIFYNAFMITSDRVAKKYK